MLVAVWDVEGRCVSTGYSRERIKMKCIPTLHAYRTANIGIDHGQCHNGVNEPAVAASEPCYFITKPKNTREGIFWLIQCEWLFVFVRSFLDGFLKDGVGGGVGEVVRFRMMARTVRTV